MTIFSSEEQEYIDRLATALRNIEITEKEMADMRLLYKCTNGKTLTGLTEMTLAQKSLFAALELVLPTPENLTKHVL